MSLVNVPKSLRDPKDLETTLKFVSFLENSLSQTNETLCETKQDFDDKELLLEEARKKINILNQKVDKGQEDIVRVRQSESEKQKKILELGKEIAELKEQNCTYYHQTAQMNSEIEMLREQLVESKELHEMKEKYELIKENSTQAEHITRLEKKMVKLRATKSKIRKEKERETDSEENYDFFEEEDESKKMFMTPRQTRKKVEIATPKDKKRVARRITLIPGDGSEIFTGLQNAVEKRNINQVHVEQMEEKMLKHFDQYIKTSVKNIVNQPEHRDGKPWTTKENLPEFGGVRLKVPFSTWLRKCLGTAVRAKMNEEEAYSLLVSRVGEKVSEDIALTKESLDAEGGVSANILALMYWMKTTYAPVSSTAAYAQLEKLT